MSASRPRGVLAHASSSPRTAASSVGTNRSTISAFVPPRNQRTICARCVGSSASTPGGNQNARTSAEVIRGAYRLTAVGEQIYEREDRQRNAEEPRERIT